jgi:osmotically inducible protein OsmC
MAMQQRRASITWHGDLQSGNGDLEVESGALQKLNVTFSARTESAGGKTSPEELLAAAHATCYAMVLANMLKQETGNAPDAFDVTAVCSLDRVEGALKITGMDLRVKANVPGMDGAKFQEFATTAELRCPVSNPIRNNVPDTVNPPHG